MAANHYKLFDTAIGRCAVAWSERGLLAVQLPEADERATRARLLRRVLGAQEASPPRDVQGAIEAMTALLHGEPSDLSPIVLDMDGVPAFHRRVYDIARGIAPGSTLTYGDIANQLGDPGRGARRRAGARPQPVRDRRAVPPRAGVRGKPGGFSANGGAVTKLRMLAIEGAPVTPSLF